MKINTELKVQLNASRLYPFLNYDCGKDYNPELNFVYHIQYRKNYRVAFIEKAISEELIHRNTFTPFLDCEREDDYQLTFADQIQCIIMKKKTYREIF